MALIDSAINNIYKSDSYTLTNYLPTQDGRPVFAWLGDTPLARISYPSTLKESLSANFAQHERLFGKPILQATGVGLKTQNWTSTLLSSLCDVDAEISKLSKLTDEQKALRLVYANGESPGTFVITSLGVTYQQIIEGKTLKADITFDLLEYVEIDPIRQMTINGKINAIADAAKQLISTQQLPKMTTPKIQQTTKKISTSIAARLPTSITRT